MGIFSLILPTANFAPNVKAEAVATTYDYTELLGNVELGKNVLDTRVWGIDGAGFDAGNQGLKPLGIWNAMGLDVAHDGTLGVLDNFFFGNAVGANANEIHPYIIYNVTPGTSFSLSSFGYDDKGHKDSGISDSERFLNFYVSYDGVTWIPTSAEMENKGEWSYSSSYDNYVYTIDNVGQKTNFVKVEYPITMTTRKADGWVPNENLLIAGVSFTAASSYEVNGQTLFEATSFPRNKEFYEEHFIAYPDFVNMDTSVSSGTSAATTNSGMISGANWGSFDEKDRSYVAMVAPGSHFYLETTNNSYMKTVGEALVANGELEYADQARIRVYSSASLSDDAAWTEWNPMPYSCGGSHTPTFNFYLPENHIYVRIVYPQKGSIATITTKDGAQVVDASGNDAAFFNDMVFTPYVAADADYTYDYTSSAYWNNPQAGTSNLSQDTAKDYGITIPYLDGLNLQNGLADNSNSAYAKGHFSIQYAVEGGKMFNLEYAVRVGSYFIADWPGNTKGAYEAEVTDGSSMEMIIETSTDNSTWTNTYETESGYAQTTSSFNDQCYVFDVSYLVPKDANYVRVSFGITGVGVLKYNGAKQFFNDCLWLRKVSVADANNVYTAPAQDSPSGPVEYEYVTDTDASKGKYDGNLIEPGTFNVGNGNTTSVKAGYGYLIGGDGGNPQMLAGTLERPYVIYDVIPGSTFSFDYIMNENVAAMSESSAAYNVAAGLGREDLKDFDFFVYGRENESSDWTYIGQTSSFGGTHTVNVPANINQIKVAFPQTGGYLSNSTLRKYNYNNSALNGQDLGPWVYNNYENFGVVYTSWGSDGNNSLGTICKAENYSGLGVGYGHANVEWSDRELFYVIYKVKPGSVFVANFVTPDLAKRNEWKDLGYKFEFKVSSSAKQNGTYSNVVTTEGQNTTTPGIAYRVPAGCEYVKVSFPQQGIIPTQWGDVVGHDVAYLTGVSFYQDGSVEAGNEAAYLYNVKYATGKKPGPDVDYTALKSANITNASKAELNVYHQANTQLEKAAGIKAKADGAFVIYKIKENTMLTVNSGDALSFEYSTDDTNYKPFEAVKTCRGYEIPAIKDRNYIKVKLDNGEAITNAYAEVLAPTVKFYIPYLDKYDLKDVAGYGAAANSVSPTINTLRPGYKFEGWTEYDDEGIYIDKTVEAVYIADPNVTYTVSCTVGDNTTTNNYKFDNRVTISADATNDKGEVFSKWVDAKGATVSNSRNFSFLVSGNIALKAVYAKTKEDIAPYIYVTDEPIITWNDDDEETWNLSVVWRTAMSGDVTVKETGILLGKDVDKAHLILWDGKTQENTFKMKHNNTATNKTAVYTVKNIKAGETRTALPYAILSNGDVIYGENVIKVTNGVKVTSTDFEFNGRITPTVLNNYLDRAVSYDAFGTADGQDRDSAIYNARDFVRKTGAKYLARGISSWTLDNNDILSGDNVTNYKNWIAEIHEVDPEVIVEGAIFENVNANVESILIPDWVLKEFGQTVQTDRYFDYDSMLHTLTEKWSSDKYGVNEWGPGNSIPDIGSSEFQMYVYYKACQYIDAGVEAIHFGQMYRIGAEELSFSNEVSKIDLASWETVLTKIRDYAKTHARRGYVLVNGHNHTFAFVKENTKQMLVDFTASPLRLVAANSSDAYSESFQNVGLTSSSGSDAAYITKFTGYTTPSGITVTDCYPYLLEFDNFGVDTDNLNKFYSSGDYVWGYDEISWYVNQQASDRHIFLTNIVNEVAGLSAVNGHVALPGKRTAFISATGASEYLTNEANIYNGIIYSTYYKDGAGKYGTYGAEIPLWDAQIAGDVDAIKAAFDSLN